jgi:8-oxo-dGTP pyrophosphatase MutT (NUDIX family)
LTSHELAAAVQVRVRAVLLTGPGSIIVILRQRPDRAPYRVLPGGAVEATDPSIQAALARELREELGAQAVIGPRRPPSPPPCTTAPPPPSTCT